MRADNKGQRVESFLRAVPKLNKLSPALILRLSERLSLNPERLSLLIQITTLNGKYCEN